MPGHIYIQVRSMLSNNTALAAYLKNMPSFIYPHGEHFLPKHTLISEFDLPRRRPAHKPTLPYGSWVRVKKGLYAGDVAVLYPIFPLGMVLTPKDQRTAFMVPRKNTMTFEPPDDLLPHLRPPLSLFHRAQLNDYKKDSDGELSLQVHCPRCAHGSFCSHDEERKLVVVGDQRIWVQSGLRMWTVSQDRIELATSISSEVLNLFLDSGHPALRNERVISQIPPLSSWQFFENDKVGIRAKAWVELLPLHTDAGPVEDWIGEGVIQTVESFSCIVLINSERQLFPKTQLRRQLAMQMMVELLPGAAGVVHDGKTGFVTGLDDVRGIATVAIDLGISVRRSQLFFDSFTDQFLQG